MVASWMDAVPAGIWRSTGKYNNPPRTNGERDFQEQSPTTAGLSPLMQ
jgi:hypothetical protein